MLYGVTFDVKDIGDTNSANSVRPPVILASGDNVYAAWDDGENIMFSRSTNSGSTFSAPTELGDGISKEVSSPQLASIGNNVFAVWQDRTDGDGGDDIKFRRSTDNGLSWIPPLTDPATTLRDTSEDSSEPKIAVSDTNVYVVCRYISNSSNHVLRK